MNSPNDLAVHPVTNDVFFTDPPYGLIGKENDAEFAQGFSGVYRIDGAYVQQRLAALTKRHSDDDAAADDDDDDDEDDGDEDGERLREPVLVTKQFKRPVLVCVSMPMTNRYCFLFVMLMLMLMFMFLFFVSTAAHSLTYVPERHRLLTRRTQTVRFITNRFFLFISKSHEYWPIASSSSSCTEPLFYFFFDTGTSPIPTPPPSPLVRCSSAMSPGQLPPQKKKKKKKKKKKELQQRLCSPTSSPPSPRSSALTPHEVSWTRTATLADTKAISTASKLIVTAICTRLGQEGCMCTHQMARISA